MPSHFSLLCFVLALSVCKLEPQNRKLPNIPKPNRHLNNEPNVLIEHNTIGLKGLLLEIKAENPDAAANLASLKPLSESSHSTDLELGEIPLDSTSVCGSSCSACNGGSSSVSSWSSDLSSDGEEDDLGGAIETNPEMTREEWGQYVSEVLRQLSEEFHSIWDVRLREWSVSEERPSPQSDVSSETS